MSRSPSRGRGDSSRGPPASSSGGSSGHSNEVGTPAVEPLPEFPEPARMSPLFRRTPSYRRYQSRYVGSYSAAIGNYYRALNADQGLVPQGVNLEHAEQTTAAGRAAELQQARGTIATESYVMRTHFEQLLREAGFITERNQWHPETPEDVNLLHGEAIRAYRRVMQWFGVCAHVPGAAYAPTSPTRRVASALSLLPLEQTTLGLPCKGTCRLAAVSVLHSRKQYLKNAVMPGNRCNKGGLEVRRGCQMAILNSSTGEAGRGKARL
jgi:hypothetical protein